MQRDSMSSDCTTTEPNKLIMTPFFYVLDPLNGFQKEPRDSTCFLDLDAFKLSQKGGNISESTTIYSLHVKGKQLKLFAIKICI
jgi:hypothetical protein